MYPPSRKSSTAPLYGPEQNASVIVQAGKHYEALYGCQPKESEVETISNNENQQQARTLHKASLSRMLKWFGRIGRNAFCGAAGNLPIVLSFILLLHFLFNCHFFLRAKRRIPPIILLNYKGIAQFSKILPYVIEVIN